MSDAPAADAHSQRSRPVTRPERVRLRFDGDLVAQARAAEEAWRCAKVSYPEKQRWLMGVTLLGGGSYGVARAGKTITVWPQEKSRDPS